MPLPSWFKASKACVMHIRMVQRGLHPFGFPLHEDPSLRCGDCYHVYQKRLGNTYNKCERVKATGGPCSDVRLKWRGCKYFKVKE